jgi:chromosome segregation ATPase
MEKQIVNMLSDIQRNLKEFDRNLKELDRNMKKLGTDVKEIKETVNRIETSQTDVIAMLKVGKQRSETDFHYLNTRITDIDKRVFTIQYECFLFPNSFNHRFQSNRKRPHDS